MKGHFNKNIQDIINEKGISINDISLWLKIPKSSVKSLLNNDFENFSYMSLIDIARILSDKIGEDIAFIKDEEKYNEKDEKAKSNTKNNKSLIIPVMMVLIIISSIYIYIVFGNVLYYREVLSENRITLEIENKSDNLILVNNVELPSNSIETFSLTKEENLVINNNKGIVVIKTPNSEYEVKLEDFEVNFENGEN